MILFSGTLFLLIAATRATNVQHYSLSVSGTGSSLKCPKNGQLLNIQSLSATLMHDELRRKRSQEDWTVKAKKICDQNRSCDLNSIPFSRYMVVDSFDVKYSCYTFVDPVALGRFLVRTNDKNLTRCSSSKGRIRRGLEDVVDATLANLNDMIDMCRLIPRVETTQNNQNTNPVIEYGQENVNGNRLPLYMIADVRPQHLPAPRTRPAIPTSIYTFLRNQMGAYHNHPRYGTDEAGHLLAHEIGGPTNQNYNFIPMTMQLNRGTNSMWRRFEATIPDFLRLHPHGRVDWRGVVIYERGQGHAIVNRRPLGLHFQYTLFPDANSEWGASSIDEMCISNDPEDQVCTLQRNHHN